MDLIITVIVFLVIVGLLFWAVRTLAPTFGIPPQITNVLLVILVVIVVLWLLQATGLWSGSFRLR
jgi:hypothetical protein